MRWYDKRHNTPTFFVAFVLVLLISILLAGCAPDRGSVSIGPPSAMYSAKAPILSKCRDVSVPVITTTPAIGAEETLYFSASTRLYAVAARNGAIRWCIQAQLSQQYNCPPGASCPPPPIARFGSPAIGNNTVYVCASGYTYALNKGDGSLRWQASTQCAINDMPFEDDATPIVHNGIVYSSSYALRERDGSILWQMTTDSQNEGTPSPQVLVNNVIYANNGYNVYAINASNGHSIWRYTPDTQMPIGGQLVVDGSSLYVGTLGSVEHPELSRFYVLDINTGKLRWQYAMGEYAGAVVHNNTIYVSSRDQYLYAFDKNTDSLRWKHNFIYPTYNVATSVGDVIYINIDGAYALRSSDGTVIWRKTLGSSQSVDFIPSSIMNNVVYLASIDGQGHSILYGLNASNGDEYWHSNFPYQLAPITIA